MRLAFFGNLKRDFVMSRPIFHVMHNKKTCLHLGETCLDGNEQFYLSHSQILVKHSCNYNVSELASINPIYKSVIIYHLAYPYPLLM